MIKIALAGNPNSGKTTLFNALTGSNQFVGNWPGVTVEKKEGKLKTDKEVIITDLPGIYSMSPYSPEEIVARNYLIDERPNAILNIVDGTNIERNLFLTTQLMEVGIPVVVAVNMMDIVAKSGDTINAAKLSKLLGCKVAEISALKGANVFDAVKEASDEAKDTKPSNLCNFSAAVERALSQITDFTLQNIPKEKQRFFALKLFERDAKITEKLQLSSQQSAQINKFIKQCEDELEDDSESIIITERYTYIGKIIRDCVQFKNLNGATTSDKIDKIVTNRLFALPIFAAVMFVVYFVSVTTVGTIATDWANDGVFGEGWHLFGIDSLFIPGVPAVLGSLLEAVNCADWLKGLILDGIVAGVGAVLGFVPQMFVLFIFLAFLEACGYMARIAFIMDRIFRRFGLSGRSFIPILIGTGCGVPGIMASRTIESDKDRKMTIMTTTFIPCSAKLPIIALIAGALFNGAAWVAPSAYFVGIVAIVCSGVILKKTRLFTGDVSPFVMELPAYRMPTVINILRSMWERGWSFIKKAGTIILLATILVWFLSNFGFSNSKFTMVEMDESILAKIGNIFAWIFAPLGWGNWQAAVAALTGLIAKENVVSTLGILYGFGEVSEDGAEMWGTLAVSFTSLSAYSFLIFNLLCAPCFAAMGAIRREMNSAKWFWTAIGYQCGFAYIAALCVYQIGQFFMGTLSVGLIFAVAFVLFFLFMLFKSAEKTRKAALA